MQVMSRSISSLVSTCIAFSVVLAIVAACGTSQPAAIATPTAPPAATASATAPRSPSANPSATPTPQALPAAAVAALAEYVVRDRGGELVGQCHNAPKLGFCYYNLKPDPSGFRVGLGRVGTGLPSWTVVLVAGNGGSFTVGEVTETKGPE